MSDFVDRARRLLRGTVGGPLHVSAPPALLEFARDGAVALVDRPRGSRLRVACVVPEFRRGSGGHSTIMHLLRGLEARGHECSVWIEDTAGVHAAQLPGETEELWREFFGGVAGDVHATFDAWTGADVVLATGWQTVHRVLRLSGCGARAYLVQDHEPEFFGTSAEAVWAAETYRLGLPCVAASPWLAELLRSEYGADASSFDLGVDAGYRPVADVARRDDLVVFYARAVTARRAVPLGVLALGELSRRREVDIAFFGEARPIASGYAHRDLGVLDDADLARLYSEATVGVVLSMTNPSLVPTEMLACGLPCVDLASDSMRATFGADGPVQLAPFDPLALADAVHRLLDAPELRAARSAAGLELTAGRTWAGAAGQVEAALLALPGGEP